MVGGMVFKWLRMILKECFFLVCMFFGIRRMFFWFVEGIVVIKKNVIIWGGMFFFV